MSKRIHRNFGLFRVLHKAHAKQRNQVLKSATSDLTLAVCEVIDNVLSGNVHLKPKQRHRLQKYKSVLRKMVDRKISLKKKKSLLIQQGGFLPILLAPIIAAIASTVLPVVGQLVSNAIAK